MHIVARQAVAKLLERAERAATREASRAVTLVFGENGFPAYFRIESRSAKDEVHSALREAERAGGLTIEWDVLAGENGQIKRLLLADAGALARYLGVQPHAELMREAQLLLDRWVSQPRVEEILDLWRHLKTVRGRSVREAADLADALRVLDYAQFKKGEDIAVRTLSATLFRSSKRLEELEVFLDILTSDILQAPPRTAEEVFAELGLIKHPPAVFLAGPASVELTGGVSMDVPSPFVGLAPRAVAAVRLAPRVRTILTVENLTVFHEFAEGRAGPLEKHLVVYTAGMPAPSFLDFYRKLVSQAQDRALLHWGDIDPGGFRIAGLLARNAAQCRVPLRLWSMISSCFESSLSYRPLLPAEIAQMQRTCGQHAWTAESVALAEHQVAFEQEALPLRLP